MRDLLFYLLFIFFTGCTIIHTSDYLFKGKNIKSKYGNGDVDVHIIGNTEWRFLDGCKKNNGERPSVNRIQ